MQGTASLALAGNSHRTGELQLVRTRAKFAIVRPAYGHLSQVRLTVVCDMPGGEGIVPWEMVHDGREYLVSPASEKVWYSNLPVAILGFAQCP